ncbi:hypothetical protein IAQ61_003593 [Plenodomus lingam]|uniref:uncharacterized protein n=1 Tax=Leptosphaeria maculans TaxID=5022 RepID=UPI00331B0C0B|nr:hypothetical protein IAQ61_003593 [Plenodomus lingam]
MLHRKPTQAPRQNPFTPTRQATSNARNPAMNESQCASSQVSQQWFANALYCLASAGLLVPSIVHYAWQVDPIVPLLPSPDTAIRPLMRPMRRIAPHQFLSASGQGWQRPTDVQD